MVAHRCVCSVQLASGFCDGDTTAVVVGGFCAMTAPTIVSHFVQSSLLVLGAHLARQDSYTEFVRHAKVSVLI